MNQTYLQVQLVIIIFSNNLTVKNMMKTIEGYTYKINQHIGKGYSSTVHKGLNDKTGQQVSIKVIEMAKLEDPINQMLLQHQITALKKLAFSNGVLHLYDVYATKNNTYIITELCEGDLGNLLKKRKNIPYPEAVEVIRQIINGYLDVCNSGYLHRDIKPANIFYKGNCYKIGDFGFAIPKKELDQHKNYNVGSPVYMPPQALKDNIYSVSCDTWAIGIIFYQIIKGVVPWRAISQQKLHQKILTQPLDQLTLGLPEIARVFLSKVLNLDPKMRMTIEEMVNWPAKLATVEIAGMALPSCSPLREIKNPNNLTIPNNPNIDPKSMLTPKQLPTNPFRFQQIPQPPPTHKHMNSNSNVQYFHRPTSYPNPNANLAPTNPTQNQPQTIAQIHPTTINQNQINKQQILKNIPSSQFEDSIVQQTGKFALNLINYTQFLHRIIKFVGSPCSIELPDLVNSLSAHLFAQLDNYSQHIRVPQLSSFEKWQAFLSSQKGTTFKTKLAQNKTKYKMFHPVSNIYTKQLSQQLIRQGIQKLLTYLEQCQSQPGNEKNIIALDYLTTFYQLYHLKNKHSMKQFLKMSKIDMIIEGNPYNVTPNHFSQVKRKLMLIDIIENK